MREKDEFAEVKAAASLSGFAEEHLSKVNRGYVCPSCKSGTGPNKTPAFSIKGSMFKCFSCQIGGDVFDLAGLVNDTVSKLEQLRSVKAWLDRKAARQTPSRASASVGEKEQLLAVKAARSESLAILQDKLDHPEALSYLEERGLTLDEARSFGLGFDERKRRITIPYPGNPWYHIDRDVTGKAGAKYVKPRSDVAGAEPAFNPDAMGSDHVFVVEGPFDYISVKLAGFEAVALCGTSWQKTAERMLEGGFNGNVTIALDDDERGRSAARSMSEFLAKAGISAYLPEKPWSGCKDASELHRSDNLALRRRLEEMMAACLDKAQERKTESYAKALGNLKVLNPAEALRRSLANNDVKVLATGMRKIDDALGGGFCTGSLYVLGAVSSLGKTTLCLQLADLLAAGGNEVLYVTLEQSAAELASKSISRIMSSKGYETSSSEILLESRRASWDSPQRACLDLSISEYESTVAERLRVIEGQEQPRVADIKETARAISERSGEPPVIFVDYLQLLAPANERATDKQAADENVRALKHLARDLNCPVVAISSLNRGSYSAAIDLSSWKESGLIEYSADALLGMQLRNMEAKLHGPSGQDQRRKASKLMEQAKSQRMREVEIIVLKNRSGAVIGSDDAVPLRYDALANTFT